jgi:hypothetical protein
MPTPTTAEVFANIWRMLTHPTSLVPDAQRLLLFAGVCLLAGLLVLVWQWRWMSAICTGPEPVTLAQLRQIKHPDELSNPWVTVTADNIVETDVTMVAKDKYGSRTKSKFFLVRVGDRWLIAEMPPDHRGRTITGYLDVWRTPLRLQAIDAMRSHVPDGAPLLAYQMDGEYSVRGQGLALFGLVVMFAGGGALMCLLNAEHKERAVRGKQSGAP